jgi:hypothetical protein
MVIICDTEVQREVAASFERAAYGIAFEESQLVDMKAVTTALESSLGLDPVPLSTSRSPGSLKVVNIMENYVNES